MKKFLLSIFAVLFAFAGAQAEETVTDVLSATEFAATGTSYKDFSGVSFTSNAVYAGQSAKTSGGAIQLRSKNSNSGIVTTTSGGKVKSVTIKVESVSNTLDIYGSNTAYTSATDLYGDNKGTKLGSLNADGTLEITGDYEYIGLRSNSGALYLTSISIVWETTGEGGGETPEPEAPAAPKLPAACNFDDAMTVEITGIAEGATAYYSLNNETDWVEGTSVEITETTTVYAKVVKDGISSELVSAKYTKNTPVTPPAEGEVVDVLNRELTGITKNSSTYSNWSDKTVSSSAVYAGQSAGGNDAIQLRSNNNNSGIVTTKSGGKAKKVAVVWQSSTSGGRTLNVYGKNTAYSAATDLYSTSTQGTLLGTIVCGTSTELVIKGDYEYIGVRSASGAMYLTSISITWDESAGVTPVVPNAPTLPASTTFEGSMMVEITGIAADATVYYTTDESDPATSATRVEYTEPFEITATTTVKAVAVNEVGASEMATATYTLFVVEETTGYYVKVVSAPADWSGKYLIVYEDGTDAYVFNGKDEANGYVSAVTDGDVIKANSEIDAVAVTIAAMEGGYSVKTADGYIYGTSNSNVINTNASAPQLNTIEFTADGVVITAGEVFQFNSASNNMRFRYYRSEQKPVQLYKYVEELPLYHTLTVTEAGYATLFLDFNAAIPAEVEAYIVTEINNGYVTLTKVEGVLPAETGIIVKAEAGDYELAYSTENVADVTGNKLLGTTVDTDIDVEAYVLSAPDGIESVGLYKAQMAGGVWLNNANKAYLPASVANGAASYSFRFGEGTTGVEKVEIRNEKSEIYDLTGRRVENPGNGIYIINGVKVFVK